VRVFFSIGRAKKKTLILPVFDGAPSFSRESGRRI
jgi:hypothetical protein